MFKRNYELIFPSIAPRHGRLLRFPQTYRNMPRSTLEALPSRKVPWTVPEKAILRAAVASYGLYAEINLSTNVVNLLTVPWYAVSHHLPGRHAMECLAQWRNLFPNSALKKAPNGVLYISRHKHTSSEAEVKQTKKAGSKRKKVLCTTKDPEISSNKRIKI